MEYRYSPGYRRWQDCLGHVRRCKMVGQQLPKNDGPGRGHGGGRRRPMGA